MPSPDPAKDVKDAVAGHWSTAHPTWTATLHVDDDYKPEAGKPTLLVADDGGPRILGGAWLLRKVPRRPLLRFTGFAVGRDEALGCVDDAVDYILTNRPAAISRIEDVSDPLLTRDRATGAFLASITMPVIVRPKPS
jgi:hypothetical protein